MIRNKRENKGQISVKLVIASRNEGKIAEIRAILAGTGVDILSLDDFPGRPPDVVEDGDTFAANEIGRASGRGRV